MPGFDHATNMALAEEEFVILSLLSPASLHGAAAR